METRVKRYSRKNRFKRKVKKGIKELPKRIIKNIAYLIVGITYAIYLVIRAFNNMIANFFMKMPRICKVLIIYLLVLNFIQNAYEVYEVLSKEYEIETSIVSNIEINGEAQIIAVEEETEDECILDSTSCKIVEIGQNLGLNDEEILISLAISKWETGNYTSSAYLNLNNVGGMMCNDTLIGYDSLEDGINAFLTNLKNNYFDKGLTTLESIQPKYCPIGAANDPNGLNQYWLSGTTKMYNELIGK